MPIRIPNDLPAARILRYEGVTVMRDDEAARQDVRPLQIAVLNLMPEKVKTETQLARQLGRTPLQVEMTLLTTSSYKPKNTPQGHMSAFYRPWEEVREHKYDGLIITGAPIERLDFEEVVYWPEMTEILDWSARNVHSSFFLCWAAQAALFHYYGIPKYDMGRKLSGVYRHRRLMSGMALTQGFDDEFAVPVSRWTEVRREDFEDNPDLLIMAEGDEAGVCLMQSRDQNRVFMFNHLEYDSHTLGDEYRRDAEAEGGADVPAYYFPDDDPNKEPRNSWRAHAQLLYGNWINMVYQTTPFDSSKIGSDRTD